MHRIDDTLPARERRSSIQTRCVFLVYRAPMRDERPFRDDQADTSFGAAAVIPSDILAGHAAGRHQARHRRHDDTIPKFEITDLYRPEKYIRARAIVALRKVGCVCGFIHAYDSSGGSIKQPSGPRGASLGTRPKLRAQIDRRWRLRC